MKPASNASPAPVVSAALDRHGRDVELERGSPGAAWSSRVRTRAPREPRLITATPRVSRSPPAFRPRSASASVSVANRTSGAPARRVRAPRGGRGRGAGRPTRGPPTRARGPRPGHGSRPRAPRRPERLAEQRVRGQVDQVEPANHSGLRSSGRRRARRADRPRTTARRSAATSTPIRPVRCPATRAARTRTPSRLDLGHEAPAGAVAPHRADQRRRRPAGRASARCSPRSRPGEFRRGRGRPSRSRSGLRRAGRRRARGRPGRGHGACWIAGHHAHGSDVVPSVLGRALVDVRPDPRPRPARDQHDPDAVDRRRPEGELRPPRRADGRGADGVCPVDPLPAPRPDAPGLAGPRPLRPVRGPRVDAPVLAAPPDRLRPDARRPQVVPAVGFADAGPPRVRR